MDKKIPVGISACLLGERVRFDGGHKRCEFAAQQLAPFLRYEPICPEMAIGLPTPRPALRLTEAAQGIFRSVLATAATFPSPKRCRPFPRKNQPVAPSLRLYRLR